MSERRTIIDLFWESVGRYPDKPALIFYGRNISYQQLDKLSDDFAKVLRWGRGIKKGDRISFVAANTPHLPIAFLAAWKIGAIVAAVNPLEKTDKVAAMIKLVDPRLILFLENFRHHAERVTDITRQGISLNSVTLSAADYLPWPLKLGYWWKNRKMKAWKGEWFWRDECRLQRLFSDYPLMLMPKISGEDLAVLQYTGGTTGIPKAATLTHGNISSNALQAIRFINKDREIVGSHSVFLGVIPFFHVYGLSVCLNMALSLGSSVVLLPKFDPAEIFKAIERYRVDTFPGIPIMFAKLVEYAKSNPRKCRKMSRSLKLCISGAGALDSKVKREFEELTEATIIEGYGLSEASPIVACNPVEGGKPGSLGKLLPDTEMKVVDGELWVRGPQVMAGYWRNEAETKEALKEGGWLATGDMVKVDEDDFLWLTDRKKDMIKVMGENVYSREVENAIRSHPWVADAAVVGLPDPLTGERVVACVVLKPEAGDGAFEAIINHCRSVGLSGLRVPKQVVFVEEIPKNIVGKILKRELKEKLA